MENIKDFKINWICYALNSLNGDEKIAGINPKLMNDIIANRHLINKEDSIDKFIKCIGPRRWENLMNSELMVDTPDDRFQLKLVKLTLEKQIAIHKCNAMLNPFSNSYVKLEGLIELAKELGWEDIS